MPEKNYYKRIYSFYDRTDEKEIVYQHLQDYFAHKNKPFKHALDIGAGTGSLTKIIDQNCEHLTLLENDVKFFKKLKKQFTKATCIDTIVENFNLSSSYDFIFMSHVLYYIDKNTWSSIIGRLLDKLTNNGTLMLVMNTDSGDWWKIFNHFYTMYASYIPFNYIPLSDFKSLFINKTNIRFSSIPYIYKVYFENAKDLNRYIHQGLLGIEEKSIAPALQHEIQQFTQNNFEIQKSLYYLNWHAEIWIMEKINT